MSPLRRLWNLARRSRLDAELQHDIETHLALIEDEERARGSTTEQARRAARARSGNPHSYRERALDEESLHERLVGHDDWFAPDQWRDDRFRGLARSAFPSPRGIRRRSLGTGESELESTLRASHYSMRVADMWRRHCRARSVPSSRARVLSTCFSPYPH